MFLNFLLEDHVQAEVRRIFFSPSSAHLQPSTSASTEGHTNSARSVVASLRQHGLREEFVSDDIQDVKFNPKNNLVKRKRVGAPSSSYKGKNIPCKSSKVVVKEEQRRLVALDYPGSEVPDVCQYKDELVVFDGLIHFFSNDSGEAVRDKIAAKLQQKKPSFVDLKTCGPDDFDFVKVANKRIRLPDGNEEFDSRTISGIYKQGAIYVRLNRSFTIFQVSTEGLFIGRKCYHSASVTQARMLP